MQIDKKYLKDYQKPDFSVSTNKLYFDIKDTDCVYVTSTQTVKKENLAADKLTLDGVELSLIHIKLDEKKLTEDDYVLNSEELIISSKLPEQFILETKVKINPTKNFSLSGMYCPQNLILTQCEAQGFRRISYSFDRPDISSIFNVTIKANKKQFPNLLSNGELVSSVDDGECHINEWFDPHPKPVYLFALVAGQLDVIKSTYTTKSNKKVDLEVYTKKSYLPECEYALEALANSMKWDEETYGLEYDLSKYMIVAAEEFNAGAMENKGLNIFNINYLQAHSNTSTDDEFNLVASVVGHEYFHNYSGNRVTLRDWFQISLKEGLTVFRENQFMEEYYNNIPHRIEQAMSIENHQFVEDAGNLSHPVLPDSYVTIDNFYTSTIYEKGSELIRMMSILLGKENFTKSVKSYFKKYDGGCATIYDFIDTLQQTSNYNLENFKNWYKQNGTPILKVEDEHNKNTDQYKFKLSLQKPVNASLNDNLVCPLNYALYDTKTLKLIKNGIHVLENYDDEITINYHNPVALSILRDFSAPIKISYENSLKNLICILKLEEDAYAKYNVAKQLKLFSYNSEENVHEIFEAINSSVLALCEDKEYGLASYILEFISVSDIINNYENINPLECESKINNLMKKYLSIFKNELENIFFELSPKLNDLNAIGERALCSTILNYFKQDKDYNDTILKLTNSENTTIKYKALRLSASFEPSIYESMVKIWGNHPVTVVKLIKVFALGLSLKDLDKLANVKEYLPSYDDLNPNHVRALYFTISLQNLNVFYNHDFLNILCKKIGEIDIKNPQLSSRFLKIFESKHKLKIELKEMIDNALLKIKPVSKNLKEQLEKILST